MPSDKGQGQIIKAKGGEKCKKVVYFSENESISAFFFMVMIGTSTALSRVPTVLVCCTEVGHGLLMRVASVLKYNSYLVRKQIITSST